MSTKLRIIGVIITIIGGLIAFVPIIGLGGSYEIKFPTEEEINNIKPVFIGGIIVVFIGLGIIGLGIKKCRDPS